jgi:hypothetical protein
LHSGSNNLFKTLSSGKVGMRLYVNLIKIENRNVFNLHEREVGGVKLRDSPVTRGRITII